MTANRVSMNLMVTCPDSEYSEKFLQGMLNRMSMSYLKYGAVTDAYPGKVSATNSAYLHLDEYFRDGNREHLIEAANYLMIEFMCPALPNTHFTPTDSDGSPGRVTASGETTHQSNQELKESNG